LKLGTDFVLYYGAPVQLYYDYSNAILTRIFSSACRYRRVYLTVTLYVRSFAHAAV